MANKRIYTRLIRPIPLAILLLGLCAPDKGLALGWEWASLPGRERVTITLDNPSPWSVNRVGTQTLLLKLENGAGNISPTTAPDGSNIFNTASPAQDGAFLTTKTNAFGYMVAREGDNKIRIDFFDNPIGARWEPPAGQPDNPVPIEAPSPQSSGENTASPGKQETAAANAPPDRPRTRIDSLIAAQQTMGKNSQTNATRQPTAQQEAAVPAPVQAGSGTSLPVSSPQAGSQQEQARASKPGENYLAPPETGGQLNSSIVETPIAGSLQDISARPSQGNSQPGQSAGNAQTAQAPAQPPSQQNSGPAIVSPANQNGSQKGAQEGNGYLITPINPTPQVGEQPQGYMPDTRSGTQIPISGGEGQPPASPETSQPGQQQAAPTPAGQEGQTKGSGQPDRELVMRVPGPDGQNGTGEPPKVEVQYDEDGKPIEPPPSASELLRQADGLVGSANYAEALPLLEELKARKDLTSEEMEDVLYLISDANFGLGTKDLKANGDKIVAASEEALNYNLQSSRAPAMMLRLGYTNLKMGNVQEAEAYFNLLKRNYPNDENIPLIYYYWGDYFFEKENYQQAADQFQYVVQNYPDSRFVREASVALARSLYNLGYYDQAFQIVDYIERRWPRFYMEYPPILAMIGNALVNMGKYADARSHYWLYYNLDPSGPEAAKTLTRIGDIYMEEKNPTAARQVYEEAARRFPNDDAGLVAQMRMAEEGIYDAPSIGDMFSVFDRPYSELPLQTYSRIVKEHPNSELAPLAQLKLAMWYLWNNRYNEALAEATVFAEKYPNHPLLPKAREVALTAFNGLASESVTSKEYDRILLAWDKFPIIQGQEDVLGSESRLALAFSEWNGHRASDALGTLEPFFRGNKDFTYGEPALNLALTILVDTGQWQPIADLYRKVEMWELTPDTQRQLDYAMALSAENLNRYDQAAALWESLRNTPNLPPEQKTYMFYFLSKAAERNKDMEQAYYLGRDALNGLTSMAEKNPEAIDKPKIKDLLAMLMNITEGTGRLQEALDWQQQYSQYVSPDDPEYPAMRYRLGQLYRQSGDMARWAVVMQELIDSAPDSLYGRMAASELRSSTLTDEINSFMPQGGGM